VAPFLMAHGVDLSASLGKRIKDKAIRRDEFRHPTAQNSAEVSL